MAEKKNNLVITGSSRGIGRGLAREFLRRGHNVVVNGRSQASVDAAIADVGGDAGANDARVVGVPACMADCQDVQQLWDGAVEQMGSVDIWINNAGLANKRARIGALDPDDIRDVIETNVLGTMYGSQVALKGMLQQGSGAIYNFEGLGSDGRSVTDLSVYAATKNTITYFTKCMIKETRDTPVLVGYLSPGIVLTHLALVAVDEMPPEEQAYTKRMYNILADRVETVTPWLVEGVLANGKHGARIAWLTKKKAAWRFAAAPFNKRDLFEGFQLEAKL
jgi:NAD(P)-dependent dehydrogenase (short-subunit alcohol dehydrogenase family)